jgi:hypothetical protein
VPNARAIEAERSGSPRATWCLREREDDVPILCEMCRDYICGCCHRDNCCRLHVTPKELAIILERVKRGSGIKSDRWCVNALYDRCKYGPYACPHHHSLSIDLNELLHEQVEQGFKLPSVSTIMEALKGARTGAPAGPRTTSRQFIENAFNKTGSVTHTIAAAVRQPMATPLGSPEQAVNPANIPHLIVGVEVKALNPDTQPPPSCTVVLCQSGNGVQPCFRVWRDGWMVLAKDKFSRVKEPPTEGKQYFAVVRAKRKPAASATAMAEREDAVPTSGAQPAAPAAVRAGRRSARQSAPPSDTASSASVTGPSVGPDPSSTVRTVSQILAAASDAASTVSSAGPSVGPLSSVGDRPPAGSAVGSMHTLPPAAPASGKPRGVTLACGRWASIE